MNLRKDNGYSQEELASLIGVSRQSVSKWELNDSVPDLDKVVRISELFDVSTDELLRDEYKIRSSSEARRMSDEDVEKFLSVTAENAPLKTLAVILCILSPVSLIIFGGEYEYGFFHQIFHNEEQAGAAGMAVLFLFIAAGVGLFIYTGSRSSRYEWIEKNAVSVSQNMRRLIEQKKEQSSKIHAVLITAGVCLILMGLIPFFLLYSLAEAAAPFGLGIMLSMIALGVGLMTFASQNYDAYQQLLQEGDYTLAKKNIKKKYSWVPGVYWLSVTALFLAVSLIFNCWDYSWIIMAAGGLLYAALTIFLNRKAEQEN